MENLYSLTVSKKWSLLQLDIQDRKCTFHLVKSLILFSLLVLSNSLYAQLSGTKNIPGDYASLELAINDLNAQGVGAGGVVLNLLASNPQTAPAGGYIIGGAGSAVLATASMANPITLQGNGNTITAFASQVSGQLYDGIFKLIGADWVTLTGFTLLENAANSITTAGTNDMTEWGIALLYVTNTDGCQNITIQNNTIDLNRTYQNTFGIYSNSTHTATTVSTSATATGASGGNHNLKIYENTVTDVNIGIVVVGPTAAADHNDVLEIGATLSNANIISNYGTTGTFSTFANVSGTVNGILIRNTKNYDVSYNSITSSNGGTTAGTLRAIYVPSFSVAPTGTFTNTISNNSISLTHGASAVLQGIVVESSTGTNTSSLNININDFTSFTSAVTSSGTFTVISNAMAYLNTNISSNTFTDITTNTTGSFTFISNNVTRPANAVCTVNDNAIVNAFNKTGAGGTVNFYNSNSTTPATAVEENANNNFSNITVTGATTISGWVSTDGSTTSPFGPSRIITGNVFSNITGGTNAVTLLNVAYGNNGSTTNDVTGNEISNISSGGTITGITTAGGKQNFYSNTVFALSSSGASAVTGFASTSGTNAAQEIFKNRIYDLSSTNAGGTVNGILISGSASGQTLNVNNNLIGDLRATIATGSSEVIRGLNITSTGTNSTFNVSYNTIYLNATSSGANFGTAGIFHTGSATATTAVLNLQNNIIVNLSTPTGTGLAVAHKRGSTNLANYGNASNYNLFYAGIPGTANLIFSDGTNSDQNLTDYKTRVNPRDASSVTESPNFLSTSGSDPDFLHVDATIATQLESGGSNITGIMDDYDNEIRQGNGGYSGSGTAPDIGADEFEGIPADLIGPAISYTLLGNTACTMDLDLSATITDASGVNSTAGTKPRLYFKKSTDANTYAGNTSGNDGWKWVEASNASSPFNFTTNYALLQSPVMTGDIIQYFVVAQDMAGTPNVGINSGTFNSPPTTVSLVAGNFPLTGTINSYTILASGLSGTVTIGAAGTYTSLTGAGGLFEAINTSGLAANLTAEILDASIGETGATALNNVVYTACSGGPFTVTIKPGAGVNSMLTGAVSPGAVIKLNGADNIIIDGSNNGSSSRNLTIQNTTTTTSGNAVIWLAAPASGNGSNNNTIKNCIIEGSSSTTSFMGMFIGGNTTISLTAAGAENNNNNTIQNNLFRKTIHGLVLYAYSVSSPDNNNLISGNNLGTATAGEGFNLQAIHAERQNGLVVSGNEIQNVSGTSTTTMYGIRLLDFKDGMAYNNIVHNLSYTGTSTGKVYGIALVSTSYTTSGNPSNALVYNNLVYDLTSTSTSSVWNITGILAGSGYGDSYYYNSIHLTGQLSNTSSGLSAAFANGDGNLTGFGTNLSVRNNIFNIAGTTTAASEVYAYYSRATTLSGTTQTHNVLRAAGSGGNNLTGRLNSIDYSDLASWQSGSGVDANSIESDPMFNSSTDLHPQPGSPVIGAGTPIGGITTDITGFTRSGTTPSMGAYEQASDVAAPSITYTVLTFTCATGDRALNGVTITDALGVPTSGSLQPRIYYKKNMGSWFSSQGTLASGTGMNGTWNFIIVAADMGGLVIGDIVSYFIIAQDVASPINIASNPSAGLVATNVNTVTTPPTTPNTYNINPTLSGTYTVGAAGTYTTLSAAINAYNNSCLTGPVVFELIDASYSGSETFPIVINANSDASSTNTLTIRPAAGTGVTISGSSGATSTALIKLDGADYVTINGLNTGGASITIENTSTSDGTVVLWISSAGAGLGAHDNSVLNCTIKGGVATNSSTNDTYGIVSGGATLNTTPTSISAGDDNDNNTFSGNSLIKVRYGMYLRGGSSTNLNTGTVISDNTFGPGSFGSDAIGKGAIVVREEDGIQITGNDIGFIGGDYATVSNGSDRVGIAFGTDASWTPTSTVVQNALIQNNIIHDIIDERTFSAVGIAISLSVGMDPTNNLVANNMLYNIKANGTSSDQTIGIGLNASNTDRIVYNTIYLTGDTDPDASATAPALSNYGISIVSGTLVTNPLIKDNIVYMDLTSSSAPAILNACINVPATYAWGSGFSDFNDFYINPANAQSRTGCEGGNGGTYHQTLANWQTAVSQDANSLDIEPVFTSGTDLHLVPASNVALDNFGDPVTGITMDIDGDMRDAMAPDMGADEFTPVAGLDVGVTALVSPSTSGCFTSTEMVTVTLKNYSLTTIDFSVNNVTVTVNATGGYNSSITLTSGTLASDATQNVTVPATIDLTTNGTYTFNSFSTLAGDITPGNDAMPPVNVQVLTLNGTYPIGAGQSGSGGYESLTAFVADYNATGCITGNIIAELYDASYTSPAESFPISIDDNPAAGIYSLTIRPEMGVFPVISGSATSIIKINGADNVTIDGSNSASTSRDLTVSNTSTSSNTTPVYVSSLGTGNGASNVTIKNTNILGGSNTTATVYGIYVGGTSISSTGTGDDNDNLTIQNNSISKCYYGIYARASSSGVNDNLMIIDNSIGSETATEYIRFRGMQIYQADAALIKGNTIFNIITTVTNSRAIELVTGFVNSEVSGNMIYEINYTSTLNSAGKGITINTGTATSNVTISNNVIYALKGHGSSTATNNSWGIMLEGGGGYNIFHNSVNLSDDRSSTASVDIHGAMYVAAGVTDIDLRNNVLVSTAAAGNVSGKTYALYSLAVDTAYSTINYNDYWAAGTNRFVGFIAATDQSTIADMQAGFGDNLNSIVSDPFFNNSTNLIPLTGSPLVGEGIGGLGVATDYLGVVRSLTMPTIGAYEEDGDFTGPVISYNLFPTTLCNTGQELSATITDISGVNTSSGTRPRVYYKKSTDANTYAGNTNANNGWKYVEASNSTSPFTFTMDFTLLQSAVMGGDMIQYFVVAQDFVMTPNVSIQSGTFTLNPSSIDLTAAAFPINGTINSYSVVGGGLATDVTIGAAGTYPTLTGAGGLFETINGSGLLNTINATILDPAIVESGTNSLNSLVYGCAGIDTLIIKPASGVTTVLSGSASALINLNGADNVFFDGSNNGSGSMDMTVRNTSTTGSTFRFINGASNNVLENVIVEGVVTSTSNGVVVFSTSTVTGGNSNNTIENCHIRDRSDATGVPGNTIYSSGTALNPNASNVISNTNLFNFNSSGINVSGTGAGNEWEISGCNIYNAQATSSAVAQNGILIGGGTGHTISNNAVGGNAIGASGTWTNTGNVVLQGISITGGNATISANTIANMTGTNTGTTARVRGIAITANVSGSVISDNIIHDLNTNGGATGLTGGSVVAMGVYFFPGDYQTLNVTGNEIYNISIGNTSALTTSNVAAGIVLTNYSGVVANNKIHSIKNNTTGITPNQPPIAAGIYSRFFSNGIVVNNMVSLGNTETTNTQFNGVMITSTGAPGEQHYYYFNSIRISGSTTGTWGSHGFLRGENSTSSVAHPVLLMNNILSMERTGGTAISYAISSQGTNADTLWSSDYNDLYNAIPTNIGYWDATGYDFANWQATTGQDVNSISLAPVFTGATDLHLTTANTSIDNAGIPVLGVTADIDGAPRNILTPDLGADEIITSGCPNVVTNSADSGPFTLKDEVACAQSGETITIDPSVTNITFTTGEIVLNKSIIIIGHDMNALTISGNNSSRLFQLQAGNFLRLEEMTLSNGTSVTNGGAFWNQGAMEVENVSIENCTENGIPRGFTNSTSAAIDFSGNSSVNN